MPKVSVVLPIYNVEQYLRECLDSVVKQTLKDIEIICVNDGSTDSSLQIIKEFAEKDARIKIIDKPNSGYGHSMNVGIDAATGEYLGIVEPDDFVSLNMFEELAAVADRVKADIVKADFYRFVTINNRVNRTYYQLSKWGDFYNRMVDPEKELQVFKLIMNTWSGIYRLDFINKYHIRHNETPGAAFQDNGFWFQGFCLTHKVYFVDKAYYVNRRDNPNSSVKDKKKVYCANIEYEFIKKFLNDNGLYDKFEMPFLMKLWHNCWFTYGRIGDEFKKEYASYIQQELKQYDAKLYEDPAFFNNDEQKRIRDFLKNNKSVAKQAVADISSQSQPLISVIVPTYNEEAYLCQCMDSLVSQSYKNLEIICVNDGSTDGSLAILEKYKETFKNVHVIDKPNGGYGAAVNTGFEFAHGDYLAIVEPDDFVHPEMYEKLIRIALQYPSADIVKAGYWDYFDMEGKEQGATELRLGMRIDSTPFRISDHPELLRIHPSVWSCIYRKQFLKEKNIKMVEAKGAGWVDNPFFFETMCQANSICWLREGVYYYRQTNLNSSSNLKDCSIPLDRLKEIYDFIDENSITNPNILRALYQRTIHYIRMVERNEYFQEFHKVKICQLVYRMKHNIMKHFSVGELGTIIQYADPGFKEKFSITRKTGEAKVSVILPVYNVEAYLDQCLKSITEQTLKDIEIICVDDESPDNSYEIMKWYAFIDERITILRQKNQGAGAARNYGYSIATGEYLSFLDSDDFFEPDMLEVAYREAVKKDIDIIIFGCNLYDNQKKSYSEAPWVLRKALLPESNPFHYKEVKKKIFNIGNGWAWDKLFRKRLLDNNPDLRFQTLRTTNDMYFVFLAYIKANGIYHIDNVLAHQRINRKGSLSVTREKSWDCFYYALTALKQRLEEMHVFEEVEQSFVNWALNFSLWHLDTLQEYSKFELYNALRCKWLDEWGVSQHGSEFFYNEKEYERLQYILNTDLSHFQFDCMKRLENRLKENVNDSRHVQLEKELRAVKSQKKSLENSYSFKVGRAITYLPRKFRNFIKK